MKRSLTLVLLFGACNFSYCQYPNINFEHIYIDKGLPEPFLASIIQDNKGFIWTAQSKLYKYDGYKFTIIDNLPKCKDCPANNAAGIYTMTTDELGIIWILMDAGIVLFDPETEKSKVLRSYAWNDTSNLYLFQRLDILKDTRGNMWISGLPGLLRVSYKPEIHKPVTKEDIFGNKPDAVYNIDTVYFKQDKYSVANAVISFYEDSRENIWAGSIEGIYLLKNGEKSFFRVDDGKDGRTRLSQRSAFRILEENKDTFWVSTLDGLNRITNVRNALVHNDKSLLEFSKIRDLYESGTELIKDRNNRIFSGLYIFEKNNRNEGKSYVSLYQGINDPKGGGYDMSAFKIMQDRTGVIWVLQSIDGILKFNPEQSQFISYNKIVADHLSGSSVNTISEDDQGNLLIGSFGEGLIKFKNNGPKVTTYDSGPGMNGIICSSEIKPGIFWKGLYAGVLEFNSGTGKFRNPFSVTRESGNLMSTTVWDILKDGQQAYMATEAGIFVYDFSSHKLSHFSVTKNDSACNRSEAFYALLKTKDGSIWTSSIGRMGLCKISYDQTSGNITFLPFRSRYLSTDNIINNYNSVLFQDSQGLIWVGNSNLHSIDIQTGEIHTYKFNTKLQTWIIRSIQEDTRNNLWMGTITGLISFNTRTGKFRIYTGDDGLPVSLHEHHSSYKNKDGRMYFGGSRGFYSFHPDSLKINDSIPPIVITDFRLYNKPVKIDTLKGSILRKNISYTRLIRLRHNQNDLTFEFAALDYNQPRKHKFAYKLEGYKDEWVETDADNRLASFTNLDPGNYVFRVKGTNNDGIWNEEGASLSVFISKPWWATLFAWIVYGLLVVVAIWGLIHMRSLKLKKDKEELEKLVRIRTRQLEEQNEEIVNQREEILSQKDKLEQQNMLITEHEELKNKFFTNVSHEFRTPLSLIQSPVEELLEDTRLVQRQKQKLNLVLKNSHKLLTFVNQLLDISKIDASSMKLELAELDVMKYLRAIAGSFTSLAETKSIRYNIYVEDNACETWSDPDKLEKIAVNLLSNAFKFTPEGGEITFSARYTKCINPKVNNCLEFSVVDNGSGIPETSLQKIFDRFYQVESSMKREGVGTGIGLALAMEMARLMHGDIKAVSELCKGSTFRVNIPLGKDHLNESEFIILQSIPGLDSLKHITEESYEDVYTEPLNGSKLNSPIVLIVEDNKDIRLQINENLRDLYHISEAIDGVAGMKKAMEIIPDLIITDLMMPRLDGFEMCDKLKNDERTSHIPVIMLTAKVTLQDKIEGYHAGADEYIPKPFHMAELKARVANMLEQRRKLRERFSREISLQPGDISITSLDEKFLNRAIEIVERHIGDENFDLSTFRSEMNMSRSTLFRKLQALTGQSPTEFIRTFRLKRAAKLLKQRFGNVTQVSYEVGFNNISYFNRSFKKLYGVSATEFARD